jgi:hypothetical protein
MIQGSVTPGSERGAASLTAKGLDLLSTTMLAIANKSVDVSLGDAEVRALRVGTSEAFGMDPLGCSRLLFISRQGRTGTGADPATDEWVQGRRQAGQSRGVRGLRRRWTRGRLLAACECDG